MITAILLVNIFLFFPFVFTLNWSKNELECDFMLTQTNIIMTQETALL